ncbi:cobalt-precorrin-6A reductase [Yoonia sediminilitoris]|uniref:Precorrin-6A/cobalt-precorrin-6A reductase n=1 Tax=Yoonia sediminilitoris TaxID=1286148 RepID=A0A2T6KRZ7_9RHOB|nr:cobalt-precorrin-6A reductase [Yoonia sediminilitoris]PUB19336.1 precorrin-6A/cobalt-precorrin-6A reductase [Yoonia sediminilitoris]RCW99504.1 precorrin-6A/cobalt-precorrin-6A reductase [Yoonia sediminilitoris]
MTLLLLAGSGEARRIAQALAGTDVVASLAGATRDPVDLPIPTRTGGFGGERGFRAFLEAENITAVLDATHPYADRITRRTARVCAAQNIPYLQLLRPPWVAEPGDQWTEIACERQAADHIPPGATVFLGTGRQTLEGFANLTGRRIICRQIDPPSGPFPFEGGEFLVGRPPFSVQDEIALFKRLSVDWLVVKNAGGALSRTKLDAARALGIPVLLIARPPKGNWPTVATVEEALAWVHAL